MLTDKTEEACGPYWIIGYACNYTPGYTREYVVVDRHGRHLIAFQTLGHARAYCTAPKED